jgi:NitT/TauT family transport system ATP-binding protein
MDEPFAAIDALLRLRLQQLLVDIWASSGKTIVYVTHDLTEAITMAHRVVVIGGGRIKAVRDVDLPTPRDVVAIRATPEVQALEADLWRLLADEIHDE